MTSYTTPNWEPLEDLHRLFPELFSMDDFMWMGTTNGVEAYKHRLTRSHINIDSNGNFWKYTNLQGAGSGGEYGYVRISDIEARRVLSKMNEFQQQFDVKHKPTYYCSQCGSKCEQESQDTIDYHFICPNKHRWLATIDIDHPTTGGQIMGFQCAGAKAIDYFNTK